MTKTFTFEGKGLTLSIPFSNEVLISATREELNNFIAALVGKAPKDAPLPEYLSVIRERTGVTISRTLPMSLCFTDEDAQTQEVVLSITNATELSAWLYVCLHDSEIYSISF